MMPLLALIFSVCANRAAWTRSMDSYYGWNVLHCRSVPASLATPSPWSGDDLLISGHGSESGRRRGFRYLTKGSGT